MPERRQAGATAELDDVRTPQFNDQCGKRFVMGQRAVNRNVMCCWITLAVLLACQSVLAGEPAITRYSAASAPKGTEALAVEWITIPTSDGHRMLAAVARPQGAGPFPAVVILHGSHGFAREYVRLAQDLAAGGVVAVAACWFAGGVGEGTRFITPIDCPAGPPISKAGDPTAQKALDTIVQAVRSLPDVDADRIGLFGHSRGGGAALNYALAHQELRAVVLDSTGYPGEILNRASDLKTPVFILHGTADNAADGGSPMTDVQMARKFEAAVRRVGGRVEAKYYAGGRHNGIFIDPQQYEDELQRTKLFFARQLHE